MRPNISQVMKRMSRESPKVMAPVSGIAPTRDQDSPSQRAGSAMTSPARGPAAAMSKSEFRSRAGERMRITAPRVPKMNRGGGAGMKYGRLTEAPYARAVK